ncbi:MAG: MATE family efflux transporter, partial [Clostridiales bacterium]|nr:MATE family efflux transporter [Clostridiales bacterium]
MNNVKNDLTEGSIGKKLIIYFLPIAAGTLFQQLYNAADAIVVGKFAGTVALAAVGGSAA